MLPRGGRSSPWVSAQLTLCGPEDPRTMEIDSQSTDGELHVQVEPTSVGLPGTETDGGGNRGGP